MSCSNGLRRCLEVSPGKTSLSINNRGVNTGRSSGTPVLTAGWVILIGVLRRQPSAPRLFAPGQPCQYQYSSAAVYAARAGASSQTGGARRRRAAHPVCQGVASAAWTRTLIPAVSPTCPACPSISGVVAVSVCTRVHFGLLHHRNVSAPPQGGV